MYSTKKYSSKVGRD